MMYSDKSYMGKRSYELREATVFARGDRFCESSFQIELPYESLSPYPDQLLLPSLFMRVGKPVAFVGLFVTLIFVFAKQWGYEPPFASSGLLLIIGVLMMFIGRKKLEITQIKNISGVPQLWIVRAGNEKENFDTFVTELLRRIQKASGKDGSC
jgi:hypothetical protein